MDIGLDSALSSPIPGALFTRDALKLSTEPDYPLLAGRYHAPMQDQPCLREENGT